MCNIGVTIFQFIFSINVFLLSVSVFIDGLFSSLCRVQNNQKMPDEKKKTRCFNQLFSLSVLFVVSKSICPNSLLPNPLNFESVI